MALDYSISGSDGNYYEVKIPIASYYKDEGFLLSETVYNNWQGYNNEDYSWKRNKDKIILLDYSYDDDKILEEFSLEEFSQWINSLKSIYFHLDMCEPIINILKNLEINEEERVYVSFS